jgi:hypothetical protein
MIVLVAIPYICSEAQSACIAVLWHNILKLMQLTSTEFLSHYGVPRV